MKKFVFIIIMAFFSGLFLHAQNLVPNYSLEDYTDCPEGPSQLHYAVGWETPDSATPDYYNACYTSFFPMAPSMDVPDNIQGYQHAHTGDAYAGIISYDGSMGGVAGDYREYMRIQLTSPLTAGTEYKVRFWWSLSDYSPYSVEQIGILITDEYINYFGGGQNYTSALPYNPTVATSGGQLNDTSNWVLHEECFIADGGEEWIYIGTFNDENDVNYEETGVTCDMETGGCFAYYYIDDVSIEEGSCDSTPCQLTVTIDATDPVCGEPNGSATAVAEQGTEPYTYSWNNGDNDETITDLSDGDYSVTVTDYDGCTAEASVTLSGEPGPSVNTSGVTINDANCSNNDGSITGITVSGGASPITYAWENGSGTEVGTDLDLLNIPSGTYTLTVTDGNGCEEIAGPFTVNDIGGPVIDDSGIITTDASCGQSNGSISGISVNNGTPPYSYAWIDEEQNQVGTSLELNNVGAGDYILEVTDDAGCISQSGPYGIDDIPGPELDHYVEDVSCYGADDGEIYVSVSGGTSPFSYDWNTGDNTQDLSDLNAGTYSLTVTDANGCEAELVAEVSEPGPIGVLTDLEVEICHGESVDLNVSAEGGSVPYMFYWGNGISFSPAGNTYNVSPGNDTVYYVYAVDANGCHSDTAAVNVYVSPPMGLDLDLQNVNCHGVCDGEATVSVSGGISPYEYSWDSINSNTLSNICAGFYELTVTDQYGCEADTTFNITEPDTLIGTIYSENPQCPGSSDGLAWVAIEGGTPPYSYQWTLGQTEDTASNLPAGLHEVTVTDANGCQLTMEAYLTDPDDIIITGVSNKQICIGGTATVTAMVAGGTYPYSYYWEGEDGEEWYGNQLNVNPEETTSYTLTVTDANGCTKSVSITVYVYPEIDILSFYPEKDSVCRGESTKLHFDISGGNGGPYEITLNGNNIITSPHTITPEYSGWYKIKVNDACETPAVYDSVYITVLELPANNFDSDIIGDCPPASIKFNAFDPNDNYTYHWGFGDEGFDYGSQVTHVYENSGHYDVTLLVTDQYGCSKRNTKINMIHVYPEPNVDFYTKPDDIDITNPNVDFYPVASDTDSIYWHFGDGDSTVSSTWHPTHTYDDFGNFEVKMIGVNRYDCRDTTRKVIKIKDYLTFYAPTAFTPNFDGENDCFSVCGTGIDPNEFSLRIYDRWGELVFETKTYNHSEGCDYCGEGTWDGTMQGDVTKGDKLLPSGMYPWMCVYRDVYGIEYRKEGVVKLIR
ncbi:MAG: PKD domain-containing protein [Bacteroidota bacterium]